MNSPYPLTYADWRRIKAATRHRKHLERLAECDEANEADWLEACRRDDITDMYQLKGETHTCPTNLHP